MNNESMAEQIIEGHVSENGNGKFTGIAVNKDENGTTFRVAFSNKQLIVGLASLTAGVLLKRYGVRAPAVVTAQKVQDVAEQAEEAATRG